MYFPNRRNTRARPGYRRAHYKHSEQQENEMVTVKQLVEAGLTEAEAQQFIKQWEEETR